MFLNENRLIKKLPQKLPKMSQHKLEVYKHISDLK